MSGKVRLGRLAVIGTVVLSVLIILSIVFPIYPSIDGWGFLSIAVGATEPTVSEVVDLRTETSKTYYLGDNKYDLVSTGGSIHYRASNGTWQDINNQIVLAQAPWNYQMTQDQYTARFLSSFTAGQVVKWEAFNESIAFQPMELQWTNNLNQIQSISMPQNTAVLVTNEQQNVCGMDTGYQLGTIRWDDAYGEGRHFWWTCDTGKLAKVLELNTLLPTPASYIINGGNPVARLNFIFSPSAGLNIYVNGGLWDKSTRTMTIDLVEFRNATNQTLWYFQPQSVWDSAGNETTATGELGKSGNNLYISIRIPYSWLISAVYPVFIDPTLTVYSSVSDGYLWYSDASYNTAWTASSAEGIATTGVTSYVSQSVASSIYYMYRSYLYFDTSSIPTDNVITGGSLNVYGTGKSTFTDWYVVIQNGQPIYPHDPLVLADWNKDYYSGDGGSIYVGNFLTSSYNTITLNTDGKGWINKGGQTKFCVRNNREIAGTLPTGYEHVIFSSAEQTNTSQDPYLYVEYTTCSPSISLNTYSWSVNSGSPVDASSNYATGLTYFTITNNSGGAVTITIYGTDMAGGGYTWDLDDSGTPGDMIYGMKAGLNGGDYTIVVRETEPYNTLVSGLADEGTQDFGLKMWTPTVYSDGNPKTGNVTVSATCD